MSFVSINAITVPEERREVFEERFAAAGAHVSDAPGFEAFEFMRPAGEGPYFVYTRWRAREDFEAWKSSENFGAAHRGAPGGPPVGTGSELFELDVLVSRYADQG